GGGGGAGRRPEDRQPVAEGGEPLPRLLDLLVHRLARLAALLCRLLSLRQGGRGGDEAFVDGLAGGDQLGQLVLGGEPGEVLSDRLDGLGGCGARGLRLGESGFGSSMELAGFDDLRLDRKSVV